MANEKSKNLKLIAGAAIILLVIIAYIGYSYLSSKDNTEGYVKISGAVPKAAGKDTPESENYKEILEQYNETKADNAVNKGESFISVLSGEKEQIVEPEPPKAPPPPPPVMQPPKPVAPPVAPVAPKKVVQRQVQKENKNLTSQTQALMQSWNNPATHTSARVSDDGKKYVESITYQNEINTQEYKQQYFKQEELDKIVDDYELIPAILQTEIDSDENSIVKAYVPNGKYKGASLFADGYKLLYENIDLTFTRMVLNGETYDITAKPIDQETMRSTMSGKVNTRWFQKVILPAIASGFGEVGDLYKNANRKIVQNGFNSYESTGGLPKGESIAGVMLGGAGSRVAKTIEQESNKIPFKEVIVPKDTVIGIQFIGPVYKSDGINYKKNKDSFEKSSINNAAINSAPNYGRQQQAQPMQMPQQQYNSNYNSNNQYQGFPVNNNY